MISHLKQKKKKTVSYRNNNDFDLKKKKCRYALLQKKTKLDDKNKSK
jgi:hypothetical protein